MTTYSQQFFIDNVTQWREFQGSLRQQWRAFAQIPPLPLMSEKLSPELRQLEPILNQAKYDIMHNISLAYTASDRFGDALTATGRNYGLTEEQAVDLANEVYDG